MNHLKFADVKHATQQDQRTAKVWRNRCNKRERSIFAALGRQMPIKLPPPLAGQGCSSRKVYHHLVTGNFTLQNVYAGMRWGQLSWCSGSALELRVLFICDWFKSSPVHCCLRNAWISLIRSCLWDPLSTCVGRSMTSKESAHWLTTRLHTHNVLNMLFCWRNY